MKNVAVLAVAGALAAAWAAPAQSLYGTNLVVNGDAESGPAGIQAQNQPAVPGWTRTGNGTPVVLAYDSGPMGKNSPGPYVRGSNYFNGGAYTTNGGFAQDIDISAGATAIDAGGVTFAASAYLGGSSTYQLETASLTFTFLSASGATLATVQLGPVDCTDPNVIYTGLYNRREIGLVPAAARKLHVALTFTGEGDGTTDGSSDNISLILTAARAASTISGVNLVVNGDAESGPHSGDGMDLAADVPGWSRVGEFDVDVYAVEGDVEPTAPGPPDRGNNFFWGNSAAVASGYQDIDLSPAATQIDKGVSQYTAAAYIGGYSDQADNAVVTFTFKKWDGTVLKTVTLGPVTPAERGNQSCLLPRSEQGTIPVGARKVRVQITMTRLDGADNDGYVDSVSLIVNPGGLPAILPGGIITAGAFGASTVLGPGAWIEIYGTNLSSTTRSWVGTDFTGTLAPRSLDGVSVTIGGKQAYLDYIASGQINALVPDDVAAGQTPVTVTNSTGTSAAYTVTVQSLHPGLMAPPSFVSGAKQYAAALHADTTFVGPGTIPGVYTVQAAPGEAIVIYGIGFGTVAPSTPAGTVTTQANTMTHSLGVTIGGQPASVQYNGMSGNYVGLYQFNIVVPNIPDSDAAPLVFTVDGTPLAQTLYTAVRR